MSQDKSIRILIVEDTLNLLKLYSHVLRQKGYQVDEADSGMQARAKILELRPDIVLLDRVLPDIDGNELCAWIKELPQSSTSYVIMLSALRTTEDDRLSGLEAGADDYLVKPVSRRELLARVAVAERLTRTQQALQASEAKHRSLADNSPDVIMRLRPDGTPTYVNQRIESILGLSPAAFVSQVGADMEFDASIVKLWTTACTEVVATQSTRRFEFAYNVGGHVRYMDTLLVPEFDQDGQVISVLAVLRDFSDRVRSEKAIARLAAVVEQSIDAVVITDPHGIIEFANHSFEQLSGRHGSALIGHNLMDCAGEDDLDFCCRFRQTLIDGAPWTGATLLRRDDGVTVDVEAHMFHIVDAAQTPTNLVAILRDISERRRNERERELLQGAAAELRKASRRDEAVEIALNHMMTLASVSGASICTFDEGAHRIVVEQAAGDLAPTAGRRFDGLGGLTGTLGFSGDLLAFDAEHRAIPETLAGLLPRARACVGVPLVQDDQKLGIMWVSSTESMPNQVVRLSSAVADMVANTLQRLKLFDELGRHAAQLEARVADRTKELAEANRQLLELDRLKSKFVSNVSHELRTPISNLKLYLSLLQRGKPERRDHYEAMLQVSTERLGQLVEDILNLSRLEISHYQPRDMEPTDLNAIISQVITLHQPQAESAGLKLAFDSDPDLPLISGDYNQLSQLVTNLVVNALHYTPHGLVSVRTRRLGAGATALLLVEDTGVGIMPEDLPHVFDRFYRGNHRQGADIPGTGLGLAIVKEIVEIHHGDIDVQSQIDSGTRIEVRLPIVPTPYSSLPANDIPVAAQTASTVIGG